MVARTATSAGAAGAGAVDSNRRRPRAWLWLATTAFFGWSLFLLAQTIYTANPVVVSVPQILASPYVVVGESGPPSGHFTVRRVLRGEPLTAPKVLRVGNLDSALRLSGEFPEYVVPLEPLGDGSFRVTAIPAEDVFPAVENRTPIYPWNESVKAQIERALGSEHPSRVNTQSGNERDAGDAGGAIDG